MGDTDYRATERLYLDKAGTVVKADDPARASLLVAPGQTVPAARAAELGLTGDADADEPAETKARRPAANKAVQPGADK